MATKTRETLNKSLLWKLSALTGWPSAAKAACMAGSSGTAKAVPCPKPVSRRLDQRVPSTILILGLMLLLAGAMAAQQKPDDIPDAPSATRPIPPPDPPSMRPGADQDNSDEPPAKETGEGVTTGSKELPHSAPDTPDQKPAPPPPMPP